MTAHRRLGTPPGAVLGMIGGSGGVGTSVLVAAVAHRAAAAARRVVAVDGHRFGGGLDVTFGLEQEPGVRWSDLVRARGDVDGHSLIDRLPGADRVAVLSYDRGRDADVPGPTMRAVLQGLSRAADLVVVDLPDPAVPSLVDLADVVERAVLVCGDGVRALAGASTVAQAVSAICPQLWLCLRGPRRPRFGDAVAEALDLPLLAWIGHDRGLSADLLHGIPPGTAGGPVTDAADQVLAQLLLDPAQVAS